MALSSLAGVLVLLEALSMGESSLSYVLTKSA